MTLGEAAIVKAPLAGLAWLGRQGARSRPWPSRRSRAAALDRCCGPGVGEAIFALLYIAFLRIDTGVLSAQLRRPGVVVLTTA